DDSVGERNIAVNKAGAKLKSTTDQNECITAVRTVTLYRVREVVRNGIGVKKMEMYDQAKEIALRVEVELKG
ncbi:4581_t:CDS:2, partial [Racocetra persica]